jgi:hypothetical protein
MPATALQDFYEDAARVRALIAHADALPRANPADQSLRSDVLRSAWMFAVGALDAYFSDAYTDVVAATIISKSRHDPMTLPDFFYDIRFPVRAVLESYAVNVNWRWRMAARRMMDRENVLKLETIQKLFNKFFRKGHRFFGDVLDSWITHPDAKKRLFGITRQAYNALAAADKETARTAAREQMEERYGAIFQRRHDCIHNCDRPRVSPQRLVLGGTVLKVLQDVEFLVVRCDGQINAEFRQFLLQCGCPAAIVAQAGY